MAGAVGIEEKGRPSQYHTTMRKLMPLDMLGTRRMQNDLWFAKEFTRTRLGPWALSMESVFLSSIREKKIHAVLNCLSSMTVGRICRHNATTKL